MQTTSRVLMGGNTAEAERVMVRKWAEHAAANGGSFSMRQEWTEQQWYTTFTINWPAATEQPPCVMVKTLWWLVLNGGFAAAVWFGFIEGLDGAQYVAKFWIWAVAVPMGFMGLTDALQKKMAGEPPTPLRSKASLVIAWFALGTLIWHGHIATAAAWGFWMLAAAVCREGAKRHRAGLSAAPAA